jgi:hypothetical protein
MRYLEQCVGELKNAHNSRRDSPASTVSELGPPPARRMCDDDDEDEGDEDEDMEDAVSPTYVEHTVQKPTHAFTKASPALYPSDKSAYSHSTTTSPAIMPQSSDPHHYSLAASSTRSSMTSPSIHPSPAFSAHTPQFGNPFHSGPPGSSHSVAPFTLSSPALKPQADREDHEATEALLMLNTDRRSWSGARGMSVKDLLSG